MSSPDTSRDNGQSPIDLVHLQAMTMSDPALEREVLGLFVAQSGNIMAALRTLPRDTAALAHTLKGSARAIGAFGAADAAGRIEDAARSGSDIRTPAVRDAVAELSSEIDLVCAAIAKLLRQP